jgi:hypothetical protein
MRSFSVLKQVVHTDSDHCALRLNESASDVRYSLQNHVRVSSKTAAVSSTAEPMHYRCPREDPLVAPSTCLCLGRHLAFMAFPILTAQLRVCFGGSLLGYGNLYAAIWLPAFRRNILPPSSWYKCVTHHCTVNHNSNNFVTWYVVTNVSVEWWSYASITPYIFLAWCLFN